MSRRGALTTAFLSVHLSVGAAPLNQIKIVFESKQRTICDFKFAAVKDLRVVARPIAEDSLQTRVDNERYDACPYNVDLKYKGIPIRLDFSRDTTLARIKNYEGGTVRFSYFNYNEDGWVASGDDIDIKKADVSTQERDGSLAVSGIFNRKNENTGRHDFCFSMIVLGADKYLTGAVCRPTENALEPVAALFRSGPVITFEK